VELERAAGTVAVGVASAGVALVEEELVADTAVAEAALPVVAAAEDDTVAVAVVVAAPAVAEEGQDDTAVELLGFVELALAELLDTAVGAVAVAAAVALAAAFVPSSSSSCRYSQRVVGDAASESMYRCTLERTWRNDTETLPIA